MENNKGIPDLQLQISCFMKKKNLIIIYYKP
jgi:hypothetical protein